MSSDTLYAYPQPDRPEHMSNPTTDTANTGRSEINRSMSPECTHARSFLQSNHHHPLPSSRSIIRALYPLSHVGAVPIPYPDPPPYHSQEDIENSPLFSSTATATERTPFLRNPQAEDPGVPSQETLSVESEAPLIRFEDDLDEIELLPAYSRFDQRRPRFPAASDILGPYPPLPMLRQATH